MPGHVQITLYFWPDTNMGAGHIACVAQEITPLDLLERQMYITPEYRKLYRIEK